MGNMDYSSLRVNLGFGGVMVLGFGFSDLKKAAVESWLKTRSARDKRRVPCLWLAFCDIPRRGSQDWGLPSRKLCTLLKGLGFRA